MLTTLNTTTVEPARLEELVDGRRIEAITFDASLFGHYGFGFGRYPLSALKALSDRGVRIVLSDIIMGKMRDHFHELASDTLNEIRRALRTTESLWQTDKEQNERFHKLIDASEKRIALTFRQSLDAFSVTTVNLHDYVPAADAKYARSTSLLESGNCNKSSRVVLESLSAWAREHDTNMLVVSRKRNWLGNCTGLDNLHGISSLQDALALFYRDCSPVAHDAVRYLQSEEAESILADLREAFRGAVKQSPLIPESNLQGYAENDINAVELADIDYGLDSASCLVPVESTDRRIIFMLEVELQLEVYVSLPFYRQEQTDITSFAQEPGAEIHEATLQGSVALIFTRDNGRWKYSGHEQPTVRDYMALVSDGHVDGGAPCVWGTL